MKRDVQQTIQLLEQVVEAKGEGYFTNDCIYFVGDEGDSENDPSDLDYTKPCCIVGHVFASIEFHPTPNDNFDTAVDGVAGVDEHFTEQAIHILGRAQQYQDKGKPWGEAFAEAKQLAMELGAI